jgi:hypothetical protein
MRHSLKITQIPPSNPRDEHDLIYIVIGSCQETVYKVNKLLPNHDPKFRS